MASKSTSNEVLLNNYIDKNVQRMIFPLNLTQKLFFCSKYNISDNFITPNSLKTNITSACGVFTIVALYIYRMVMTQSQNNIGSGTSKLFYFINLYSLYFYFSGYLLIFIQNIAFGTSNVSIVIIIQSIYKSVHFNRNKLITFIVLSWISTITLLGISVSIFLYCNLFPKNNGIVTLVTGFTFLAFDVNMIYGIRIMVLIRDLLVSWIEQIRAEEHQSKNWDEIFDAYKNILKAFTLYKKLYQAVILFHAVDTFFRALGFVQTALEVSRLWRQEFMDSDIPLMQCLTLIWVMKDLSLQFIQSIECGTFYRYIEEADNVCIVYLKSGQCSDTKRRVCKNIIRLKQASFGKMTACGMFVVDVTLPVSMVELLTNYTIVLLQFAFL